jgi:hypothetical protein
MEQILVDRLTKEAVEQVFSQFEIRIESKIAWPP